MLLSLLPQSKCIHQRCYRSWNFRKWPKDVKARAFHQRPYRRRPCLKRKGDLHIVSDTNGMSHGIHLCFMWYNSSLIISGNKLKFNKLFKNTYYVHVNTWEKSCRNSKIEVMAPIFKTQQISEADLCFCLGLGLRMVSSSPGCPSPPTFYPQ